MNCKHCGFELRDNAKFCDNCGKVVEKIVAPQESFVFSDDDEIIPIENNQVKTQSNKFSWILIISITVLLCLFVVKATDYYSRRTTVDIESDYVSDVESVVFYETEVPTEGTETMVKSTNKQSTEKTVSDVPTEYLNALIKAETYSEYMHMSKKSIYDQLVSEYGENFPEDAAQYAIDNLVADWNANALETAKAYYEDMSMSKSAVYEQLISEYGEQFTESEAQYAIDHLE